MEDVVINIETPQTSLAATDSQCHSEESTRASTPTENGAEDIPANSFALKPPENDDAADDVTMKDLGLKTSSPTNAPGNFASNVATWPSSAVIDPGSSPGEAGKLRKESVDYGADPPDVEELSQTDSFYLCKP